MDERKVTAVATYNPMNNDELVHYQGDLYCEPQDQARDTSAALVIRRRGPGSLIHEALEAAERGETVPESSWLDAYADELLHWVTTNETNAIEVADYNSTSPEYVEMTRIRSADVPPPAASDTFHRARSALFMAPRHELYRRTSAPPLNPELVIASPSTAYGAAKPARRRPSYFEDEHEEPRLNESKPGSKGFRLGDADEQQQKKQQPGNEQYPIDTLAAPPAEATVRSNEERKHPKEADVLRIDDDLILVASANGILMLERDVEVYAWRERRVSTRTERSSVTNAETKTEEYAYTQEWMSIGDLQDSSKFESPMGHENPDPRLLPIVRSRYFASTVQLGPFILGRHELGPDGRPHISEDVKSLLRLIPRRVLPVRKALLRIESITRHAKEAAAEWIDGAWQPASTNYPSAPACIELLSNREDEWHYLLVRPAERQREINFLTSTHVLGRQTTENFRATWRTASHREQFRQRYSAMYAGDGGDELVEESDYFDQYEEVLEGPSIGLSTVDDTSARPLAHALEYRPVPGGFEEPPTYEEATREATSSTPGGVLPWLSDRLPRVEENYFPFGRPLSLRSSTYRPRVGDLRVRWTVVRGPIPLTLIARQLAPLAGTFSQLQDHLNPITLNLVRSASGPETLTIRPPSGEEEVQWRAERYNLRPRLVDIDIGSVYQGRIPLAETIQRQKLSLSRLIFFGKLILGALTGLSAFSIFRSIGECKYHSSVLDASPSPSGLSSFLLDLSNY